MGKTTVDLIFAELEKFPQIGREYAAKDFVIRPGGCANTPMALSKLGMPVVFVSSLGNDFLGDRLLVDMRKAGLPTESIYRGENVKTNITAVLSVGFDRGFASWFPTWRTEEVDKNFRKYVEECSHVHFSLKDCLTGNLLDIARSRGCTISIDATWDDRFTLSAVEKCLQKCDIFFCNNLESSLITNAGSIEGAVDILKNVSDFFVLKLGAEGSVLYKSGMCLAVPAPYVERVCDTTGAGDAFVAGFLYGYLNGQPFEECLKFGSASGTLTTTFYGGSDERYTLEKVVELKNTLEVSQLY